MILAMSAQGNSIARWLQRIRDVLQMKLPRQLLTIPIFWFFLNERFLSV